VLAVPFRIRIHIVLPTILSFHFIISPFCAPSSLRLRFAFIRLPSLSSSPNLIFRPSHRIPSLVLPLLLPKLSRSFLT
jgi:hypothetical protein